ncbi:MAG: type IV secretory system conjugative DNA transfer family protein [Gemmataceae bacterium]
MSDPVEDASRGKKATRKRQPRATRAKHKLPDDGAALFLGWEGTEHVPTLGFKPSASPNENREPLTYGGDGHLMTTCPRGPAKASGPSSRLCLPIPGSIIVTDIKGENYQVTARHRREMGSRSSPLIRSGS